MPDLSFLPEVCFVHLPGRLPGKQVVAIRRGESGYFETSYDEIDPTKAVSLVEHMNRKMGITPAQAEAMLVGSMFGWDSPGVLLAKP